VATKDEVRLTVPARPEFLRLARVTAAGLASRLGFSFDEVEDLRLAIDELCYGMTGAEGREGTVQVRYVLGADQLIIEGSARIPGPPGVERLELSELSEVILTALVDEHEFADGSEGPRFRLVKQHHELDADLIPK
jgi:anti-sigma regulatory factor (Ser/Thr protein kinase)